MKYIPLHLRESIVESYEEGNTFRQIARKYNVSIGTVHTWVQRHNLNEDMETRIKSGRKRKTTSQTDDLIYNTSIRDAFKPATEIKSELGLGVSVDTVRRRLKERGLHSRVPASAPVLKPNHIAQRLEFAVTYEDWTVDMWRKVIFSDEKIFRGCGQGSYRVWRPRGTRYESQYLRQTDRYQPFKINVWGCICGNIESRFHLITDPTLKTDYYVNTILENLVVPMVDDYTDYDLYFVHDQASPHTAKRTREYLEMKGIQVLPWPPKGADMNPIENIWAEVERRTSDRRPANENELWDIVNGEFLNLDRQYIDKLIESMPRRLVEVRDAEGQWTRY